MYYFLNKAVEICPKELDAITDTESLHTGQVTQSRFFVVISECVYFTHDRSNWNKWKQCF